MTRGRVAALALAGAILAACQPALSGIPVACEEIAEADCLARAETGLRSLPAQHPPVAQITVTCDAERCDGDEGPGRVIIVFSDGSEEVMDIGFGRTN